MSIIDFKPARTAEELNARIARQRRKLGMTEYNVWFRGQSKFNYNLIPGLFRSTAPPRWQSEHNLFSDFMVRGRRFLPQGQSSWEVLSTMQHWGAPTRVLDWSTSFNVALFFALYGECNYPVIWMINPFELNEKAVGVRRIFDELVLPPYQYAETLEGREVPHKSPIALSIAWTNDRIERQAGLFTVHGTDITPLNEQVPLKSSVRHVVIDNALVPELRMKLIESGDTPDRFFPDLAGICATLKWKHELDTR